MISFIYFVIYFLQSHHFSLTQSIINLITYTISNEISDDEFECGHYAPIPTGGPQDSTPHTAALLRLQGHLGLDNSMSNILHGHHGALQRGLQEQNVGGRFSARGGLNSGRHIFHRHCA